MFYVHVVGGSRFLRACFSRYSTLAYHAPPRSVSRMPNPLIGVIVRLKSETANRIVNTCLTFAVSRDLTVKKKRRSFCQYMSLSPTHVKSLLKEGARAGR